MKRILIINHAAEPSGGTDEFIRLLKFFSSQKDYVVDGIYPKGELEETFQKYCTCIGNYPEAYLPVGLRPGPYLRFVTRFWKQYRLVLKMIGDKKYDACIFNVSVLLSVAFAVKKKRIKSFVFVRETVLPKISRIFQFKTLIRICNYFACVSEFNTRDFKKITGRENVITTYSSVESDTTVSPETLAEFNKFITSNKYEDLISDRFFKFICTATVSDRKNQLQLIKALVELKKRGQIKGLKFLFLGNLEDLNYFEKINKIITDEQLSDYCYFLGNIKKEFIYCFLSFMDAFILTSKSEGFPLSIVEAMKFKIPVIATNVGGIGDMIINDKSGIITSENIGDICGNILKIQNIEYKKELAENAFELYKNNFDLNANLNRVKNIIESF